ncbi:uncharacterized protein LOC122499458 isoform X2 [Leptopilina heterotoma]|uniref:uncharacterized protein LOC122499458 isoform X2 n=1 Tax=Leptopilina heterotoma TaxID=63436 RepID=UPI001CAA1764|nr:uncharacterized protein LOC122499458 isoform X2 [Leptopilina heterotoma]
MSVSEEFKSQILKIIENFATKNLEESEHEKWLTKWEIREILNEIERDYLEEKIETDTIDNETKASIVEMESLEDLFNQTSSFLNDLESFMNKTEEKCRNIEVDVNTTAIIEPPLEFTDELNATNTKMPISPIVLLNDVGRTDTFEIKSPGDTNNLLPPTITENKKNLPDGKTIQEFMKKLDYHENKLFNIYTEFKEMKGQFQKDVKQTKSGSQNLKKSPTPSITYLKKSAALTSSPKLGSSARRSISFSSVTDRKKSSNFNTTSTLLNAREKIRSALQNKKDTNPIPRNPKYANVQSTIPKAFVPKKK